MADLGSKYAAPNCRDGFSSWRESSWPIWGPTTLHLIAVTVLLWRESSWPIWGQNTLHRIAVTVFPCLRGLKLADTSRKGARKLQKAPGAPGTSLERGQKVPKGSGSSRDVPGKAPEGSKRLRKAPGVPGTSPERRQKAPKGCKRLRGPSGRLRKGARQLQKGSKCSGSARDVSALEGSERLRKAPGASGTSLERRQKIKKPSKGSGSFRDASGRPQNLQSKKARQAQTNIFSSSNRPAQGRSRALWDKTAITRGMRCPLDKYIPSHGRIQVTTLMGLRNGNHGVSEMTVPTTWTKAPTGSLE